MIIFYDARYNATGIVFDTTRKASCIASTLHERPIPGIEIRSPQPVSWADLSLVHDETYLRALETGTPPSIATSANLGWDEIYPLAIRWSTGGLCDAVVEALERKGIAGTLSSGLHHAYRDHGKGFCSLNGLALGAIRAVRAGARRILIIDLDAHCGGGTKSIVADWPEIEQIDVSVVRYDDYVSTERCRLVVLENLTSGEEYLEVVKQVLDGVVDPGSIDLVIYNAGMDPHRQAGGVSAIDTDTLRRREDMVFGWARSHGLPVAWTIAGGYSSTSFPMDELVELHRLTIDAAAAHTVSEA